MKIVTRFVVIGLILAVLLTACEGLDLDFPWLTGNGPTATIPPGEISDLTPTPEVSPTLEPTPGPVASLTVWVPPEMDPLLDTDASQVFANRLQMFSDLNDGLEINVRVKAASGAGGLLDSLTATSAAAPDALPDVIALSRSDLETAALKGLIFAMDGLTDIPDDSDWYNFTKEMALMQGSTFGLPFAADSLTMVYRPASIPEFSTTWTGLLETEASLVFPSESDQALFPLSLYLAAGGVIQDNQRRPMLEVEPLTEVFRLFQGGVESGVLANSLNQYQTMGQAWTAFKDEQTNLVVSWTSDFLKEGPADAALAPLLPVLERAVSLGTGMSWAVASPEVYRHPMAVALAEFLVQPEFLSTWAIEAGYIPPRPSALEAWQDQSLVGKVSQIAVMTQLIPSNDILTSLGPVLREGTRQILQEMVDPAQAAQVAVESLEEQ